MTGYTFFVWIHILAAAAWVGSMVFFAVVVVPVLRRKESRESAPLLEAFGKRFRALGWGSLGILIATGIANLRYRGIGWSMLEERAFWSSSFGRAFAWKMALVAAVLVATIAHEAVASERAIAALEREPSSDRARRARRLASWIGRLVMLASVAILFFAVAMVRGLTM
jgi:uncharacterized membrane protein